MRGLLREKVVNAFSVPHDWEGQFYTPAEVSRIIAKVSAIGGPAVETCWQTDWEKFLSPIGTGVFLRRTAFFENTYA